MSGAPSTVLSLLCRADCIGAGLAVERLVLDHGWDAIEAGETKLLVIELCSNAVRHAHGGVCTVSLDATQLEVTVEDEGPGLPAAVLESGEWQAPAARGGLGAGLACARRFSSELVLSNLVTGGARVVARRRHPLNPKRSVHG